MLRPAAVLGAMLALVVAVVAQAPFTQTFPAVSVLGSMTQNCDDLVQLVPGGPIPLGYDHGVTFDCGIVTSRDPAFVVADGPVEVQPSFTLVGRYSTLYIYPAGTTFVQGDDCGDITNVQQIENGVEETIGIDGWNYCAQVNGATVTGQGSFSVSWSL